jgi:hypothetical protein
MREGRGRDEGGPRKGRGRDERDEGEGSTFSKGFILGIFHGLQIYIVIPYLVINSH